MMYSCIVVKLCDFLLKGLTTPQNQVYPVPLPIDTFYLKIEKVEGDVL